MFGFGNPFHSTCNVCGAEIADGELHQEWHNAMNLIVRKVIAPEMSDEEWDKFMAANTAIRDAERAAREEARLVQAEEAAKTPPAGRDRPGKQEP